MRLAITFQRVDPSKGGAETYVADLCRRLVSAGHEVSLFANEWKADALPPEVRCVRVSASGWTRGSRIWSFAKNSELALKADPHDASIGFINTWHQDILIPQGGVHQASLEANSIRYRPGLARTLYVLGKKINPKWWNLYRPIEERQYDPARATRVVAVSHMVAGHLKRFHQVDPRRIRVIPNAIDAGRFEVADAHEARAKTRAKHGLKETDVVGLFVAHNYRLKGLQHALNAMLNRSALIGKRPTHLLVCGGGNDRPFRAEPWSRLGNLVHFVGFAPSIRDYFHAADFFVLPSYYDPCSLVIFEALACGLPVITTKQNGAGEVVTEGREGFVISRPDDTSGMQAALDRLVDDNARAEMSRRAVELGRQQSLDRHVHALLELCNEVAESKRATPGPPHKRAQLQPTSREA